MKFQMRSSLLCFCVALSLFSPLSARAECPSFEESGRRISARVEYFHQQLQARGPTVKAIANSTDVVVALTGLIAARAREEARVWLVQQMSSSVCDSDRRAYFTNTCQVVREGQYPGPSMTKMSQVLRQDVYALPACYVYLKPVAAGKPPVPCDEKVPANDTCMDPYVIEALLVAIYMQAHQGSEPSDELPSIDPVPQDADLASYLVLAVVGRGTPIAGWTPSQEQAFKDVRDAIVKQLNPKSSSTSARILKVLAENKKKLDVLAPADLWADLQQLRPLYLSATQGEYLEAALIAAQDFLCVDSTNKHKRLCDRLTLIGEVADANSREEMDAALDRLISPVGAWKRKQSEPAWSLNAMAGVSYGYERLKDSGGTASHSTMGLYMPIGVEHSWTMDWWYFRSWALGASALDVGGLLSYSKSSDLAGGETSTAPNDTLSSVISPGVYLAFGIKDSPFRCGLSFSRTPELRSVDFSDGTQRDVDSERLMLFLAVDVTLLTF